jgi:F-type H+-transporting ATPase subunit b
MRMRTLLAAGLLGTAAVVTLGSAASAQEEGEGRTEDEAQEIQAEFEAFVEGLPAEEREELTHLLEELSEANEGEHADAECIPILIEGGSVDDCQEAPSPILPEPNEILWGAISFMVLFVLLRQFAYPGIKKAMEARTERIRSDLAGAETAKEEAERVLSEYRAQLTDARAEAGRIIEEARQQADAVRRDQEARVQTEIAAMRERAASDVDAAKAQALADLRGDVASLAIGAAEVIVQRSLDRDTQVQLVDQYIESLGSRAN